MSNKTEEFFLENNIKNKTKIDSKNATKSWMEEMRNDKMLELEEKKAELQVAKLQAEINKLTAQDQPITQPALNLINTMITQELTDPKRRAQFLKELDEESIEKLGLFLSSGDSRSAAIMGMIKSPTSNLKDIIEIVKLLTPPQKQPQPSNQTDLKGIAEVFKLGIEAARSGGQPQSMQEGLKYVIETFVQPFQTSMNQKQQDLMDAKLEAIKAQMPPPLPQQIAGIKSMAGELGLTSNPGGGNAVDLRLEEMRQSHDLDMERLRWEQQKFMLQSESERDKWSAIQNTFSPVFALAGPELRNQLSKLGNEVGKSLGQPSPAPQNAEVASFTCPSCNQQMNVPYPLPAGVKGVKCARCGTETPIKIQGAPEEEEAEQPVTPPPGEEAPPIHKLRPKYR